MYDVIYINALGQETPLAQLQDRGEAVRIACEEAAARKVGRMMLTGSRKQCNCVCVVPVDSAPVAQIAA